MSIPDRSLSREPRASPSTSSRMTDSPRAHPPSRFASPSPSAADSAGAPPLTGLKRARSEGADSLSFEAELAQTLSASRPLRTNKRFLSEVMSQHLALLNVARPRGALSREPSPQPSPQQLGRWREAVTPDGPSAPLETPTPEAFFAPLLAPPPSVLRRHRAESARAEAALACPPSPTDADAAVLPSDLRRTALLRASAAAQSTPQRSFQSPLPLAAPPLSSHAGTLLRFDEFDSLLDQAAEDRHG
jgi:hypothetical protein